MGHRGFIFILPGFNSFGEIFNSYMVGSELMGCLFVGKFFKWAEKSSKELPCDAKAVITML